MTTIPELEAKLAKLQKQLEELKQQSPQSEQIPLDEFLLFEPKIGDGYSSILDGQVVSYKWQNDKHDIANAQFDSVFRTERVAKIIMENRITLAELKRLANFVPDWTDPDQEKWVLAWNFVDDEIVAAQASLSASNIYFTSKRKALEAGDAVGHARIKQLRQYGV